MSEPSTPAGGSPRADRPRIPEGYGLPTDTDGLLTWDQVEARLVPAIAYWMATVRPDGRPHVVPRWGVWVQGRFWYDGAPTTVHARNLEVNPACTLNLENGTEAVIIEGESHATRVEADGLGGPIAEAFSKYHGHGYSPAEAFSKYHGHGYSPGPDSWSSEDGGGLRVLTPTRALAWFSFPADCTRFRFGSGGSAP